MNRCWRAMLLVLIASAAPPMAMAQDALETLEACIRKLDPDTDIGYQRIAGRCRDLAPVLEASGGSAWLPADWKRPGNNLSAASLKELRVLLAREPEMQLAGRVPRVERLPGVLANAGLAPDAQHERWWKRYASWLRELLENGEDASEPGWFARLVAHVGLSQALIELMGYVGLGTVVLLAGLIVVNELRVAGVLKTRAQARPSGSLTGHEVNSERSSSWQDVEQAPLPERPRLLLQLITTHLMNAGRLPPTLGLTVQELVRAAELPAEYHRSSFTELAGAAEHVRFSDRELSADAIERILARGRELLEHLDRCAREGVQARMGPDQVAASPI